MAARPSPASRRRRRLALFGAGALLLAAALAAAWHVTDGLGRRDDPGDAAPLDPDAASAQPRRARLPAAEVGSAPTALVPHDSDRAPSDPYAIPAELRVTARLETLASKPATDALLALFDPDGALLATGRADSRGRVDFTLPRPPQAPFTKRFFPLLVHGRGFAPTLRRRSVESGDTTLEVGEIQLGWISGETDCDHLLDLDDATRARRLWAWLSSQRSPFADTARDRVVLRVLDAQGEPAPHALVRRFSRADDELRPYLDAVFVRPPPRLHFAWADADGFAELPLPDAAQHYVVAVARGHHATGLWLPSQRATPVDVRLASQPVRQFRLSFGDAPVDGSRAEVRLWRRAPGALDGIAALRVLDPVVEYSAERARWLLRAEPDQPVMLEVLHPQHGRRLLALEPSDGTRNVPTFDLGASASFELHAHDTRGRPHAGQRFRLEQLERPDMPPNTGQKRVVVADADGVLHVRALAPGAWHVEPVTDRSTKQAQRPDRPRLSAIVRLDLEPGEHLVTEPLVYEGGSELLVRFVDSSGRVDRESGPPALSLGEFRRYRPDWSAPERVAGGRWRFLRVPSGEHEVSLRTEHVMRGTTRVSVPADSRVEIDLHVSSWVEVSGRVTHAGAPVPGAQVVSSRHEPTEEPQLVWRPHGGRAVARMGHLGADAEGRFVTRVLEGGELWLWAMGESSTLQSKAIKLQPTDTTPLEVELVLRPLDELRDDDASPGMFFDPGER